MAIRIIIETIPHEKQRYATVGDWYLGSDASIHINVSDMGDWRKEAAVAIHELVEVLLCQSNGVSQVVVDDFDMEFESRREVGDVSEPGDHPTAPYKTEHCIASGIERIVAAAFGLSWSEYEDKINSL